MTIARTHLALGAAGVVAGIALGATGFAHAADPSPAPSSDPKARILEHKGLMPFGRGLRGDHRGGYGGLVTAIDGDSLTLRTPRGTETVTLNSSTTYYDGQAKTTRSAVGKGDLVHVRLVDPRATTKVAAVVTIAPAHLVGFVTEVGDSTLTIKDLDGFTRTIRTSSSTTYLKDGATGARSDMKVGTLVRAVGKVDADGTTLDATRVATGLPDKADRRGPGMPMPDAPMDAPMMDGPNA